jgi:hypothetical protein
MLSNNNPPDTATEDIPYRPSISASQQVYTISPSGFSSGGIVNARVIDTGINRTTALSVPTNNSAIISRDVREFLKSHENKNQVRQTLSILNKIDKKIVDYNDLNLSQIHILKSEDNTLGLTWKIADATLGIAIDPNPDDSSWFLLRGEENRGLTAFGNFKKFDDLDLLLNWIIFLLERIKNNA